jgi:GDP-mannose transporter
MSRSSDEKKRFLDDHDGVEMGEKQGGSYSPPRPATPKFTPTAPTVNNPLLPIIAYCGSSILMTVTNKYVLGGTGFNLNFFLLAVQVRQNTPEGSCAVSDT